MVQKYEIVFDGQLGPRAGTLRWTELDGAVRGTLSLFGFDNEVVGQRRGDVLELSHQLKTVVSRFLCETHAELRGDEIAGVVTSRCSRIAFHGRKADERTEKGS